MTTSQGYEPQLPPEYTDPQPVETVDGLRARLANLERRFGAVNVSGFDDDTQAIEAYIDALESDLADVMEERDGYKKALERIMACQWWEQPRPKELARAALDAVAPGGRE